MVVSSFIIATAAALLMLLVLVGFNRATYLRGRIKMARELACFLDDADVPDLNHGSGTWRGMPVRIALNHFSIDYQVDLPYAVVPYRELLERHGGQDLAQRLRALELRVDEHDRLVGSAPRENGLAESLISIEKRIALAAEVRALRAHAPRQLELALERAHSTAEVDELLMAMTTHYPDAVETAQAIETAVLREPQFPDRIRERVAGWLQHAKRPVGGARAVIAA